MDDKRGEVVLRVLVELIAVEIAEIAYLAYAQDDRL
jgi:hypothetical protein